MVINGFKNLCFYIGAFTLVLLSVAVLMCLGSALISATGLGLGLVIIVLLLILLALNKSSKTRGDREELNAFCTGFGKIIFWSFWIAILVGVFNNSDFRNAFLVFGFISLIIVGLFRKTAA